MSREPPESIPWPSTNPVSRSPCGRIPICSHGSACLMPSSAAGLTPASNTAPASGLELLPVADQGRVDTEVGGQAPRRLPAAAGGGLSALCASVVNTSLISDRPGVEQQREEPPSHRPAARD